MHQSDMQDAVKELAMRIAREFDPVRIVLFGSRATGRAAPDSDLDFLVVLPVKGSVRETARAMDRALTSRTIPLDLIVMTPEQYERQKDVAGSLVSETLREGKIIYERAA